MSVEDAMLTAEAAMNVAQNTVVAIDDPAAIDSRLSELAASIEAVKTAYAQQSDQLANVQTLSEEFQEQLGALSTTNSDLETFLEEKNMALADAETELVALRQAYETRNQEYDLLNAQLAATEEKFAVNDSAKATQDERIREIGDRVTALIGEFETESSAELVDPSAELPDEAAPVAETAAEPAVGATESADPISALAAKVELLAVLTHRKVETLQTSTADLDVFKEQLAAAVADKTVLETNVTDAQNRAAGFQVEIANRSAELEALNEQITALTAENELSQAERQRLAGALAGIAQQVGVVTEDAGPQEEGESAKAAEVEGGVEEGATEVAAEATDTDDAIARTSAAIAGLVAKLHSTRTALEDEQSRAAVLQVELSDRNAQIDELTLRIAETTAASELSEADRQRLADALAGIAQQVGVLAEDESPAETEDEEAAEGAVRSATVALDAGDKISRTTAGVAGLVVMLDSTREALDDAQNQVATLEEQLGALTAAKTDLEATVSEKENAVFDLETTVTGLQEELAGKVAEVDALTQQVTELEAQLAETIQAKTDTEAQLAEVQETKSALEAQLEVVNGELVTTQQQLSDLDQGLKDLSAVFEAVTDEVDAGEGEMNEDETQRLAAAGGTAALIVAARQKNATLQQAQVEADALSQQLVETQQAKTELEQTKADLEGQLATAQQTLQELQTQVTDYAQAKSELEGQVETLNSELAATQQQLGELDQGLSELSAALDEDNDEADEVAGQRLAGIGVAAGGTAAVALAARKKKAALREAQVEADALNQQLAETEQAKTELEQTKTDLEAQLATAQQTLQELQTQVTDYAQAKSELEGQVETLNSELAATQQQLGELDQGLSELSAALDEDDDEADEVAGQRLADIGVAVGGTAAVAVAARKKKAALREAQAEADALRQQLAETEQAKAELEQTKTEVEQAKSDLESQLAAAQQARQDLQTQLSDLQQAKLDLESQIDTQNTELLATQQQMDVLNDGLSAFSAAIDSDDEESEEQAAQRLAATGVVAVGSTALIAASRKRNARLKQTEAEMDEMRGQLQSLIDGKAALSASIASQAAEIERLNGELAAVTDARIELEGQLATRSDEMAEIHTRYDALQAQLAQATEEMQSARAELQLRSAELEQVQTDFTATTAWQQRAPAVVELGQSLALMADTKLSAANSAVAVRALPQMVNAPQDLTDVKGIGRVFEQRLYEAGIGTYWELATLADDDLKQVLQLNELQLLHMDLDAIRADARRLAEETGTVGQLWDGEAPDDFEPIDGIGKIFEQRLYDAGIRTYRDLAAKTSEQLAEIVKPRPPAQPDFESWIAQARSLIEEAEE